MEKPFHFSRSFGKESDIYRLGIMIAHRMKRKPKSQFFDDHNQPLRAYLHRHGIYLSYLEPNKKLSFRQKLAAIALHANHVAIVIRLVIILILKPGHPIMRYIVDQNAQIGIARNYFYLVSLIWAIFSNIGGIHLRLTELSPSKQKWTTVSELFYSQRFHGEGSFETPVRIMIILGHLFFYSAAIVSFLYVIPFFFWAPKEYWLFGIIAGFHQLVWGGVVASWTMLPLFCFHMYVYGRLFKMKSSKLIDEKRLNITLFDWVAILRELKDVYHFYKPFNQLAFVSTFLAQILVAYFVFFSKTSETSKIVFGIYFLLNWMAGQSLHFFASSFTQRNINFHATKMLKLSDNTNFKWKKRMKLLKYVELVQDQNFFTVLASITYSSRNFILCLLEAGSALMLMIANRGSKF